MKILPGDIFGIRGSGLMGWLNTRMTETRVGNHTDRYHFGLIADPVLDERGWVVDFETRESIMKGPSTLRFFAQYVGRDVELYRLVGMGPEEGLRLVRSVSLIGACPYGFRDFAEAFLDVFCLMVNLQFPPYRADQFRVSANEKYICTEIPAFACRQVGRPLEPAQYADEWVIPVVYLSALESGILKIIYKGNLEDLYDEYRGDKEI